MCCLFLLFLKIIKPQVNESFSYIMLYEVNRNKIKQSLVLIGLTHFSTRDGKTKFSSCKLALASMLKP